MARKRRVISRTTEPTPTPQRSGIAEQMQGWDTTKPDVGSQLDESNRRFFGRMGQSALSSATFGIKAGPTEPRKGIDDWTADVLGTLIGAAPAAVAAFLTGGTAATPLALRAGGAVAAKAGAGALGKVASRAVTGGIKGLGAGAAFGALESGVKSGFGDTPLSEAAKTIPQRALEFGAFEGAGAAVGPALRGLVSKRKAITPQVMPPAPAPKPPLALGPGTQFEAGTRPTVVPKRLRVESGGERLSRTVEQIRPQVEELAGGAERQQVAEVARQVAQARGINLEREFHLASLPGKERLKAIAERNHWLRVIGEGERPSGVRRSLGPVEERPFVRRTTPTVGEATTTTTGVQRVVRPGEEDWQAAINRIRPTPENQKKAVGESVRLAKKAVEKATAPPRPVPRAAAMGYREYSDNREFVNRVFSSVEGWLRSKGAPGRQMADMTREASRQADQQINAWTEKMLQSVATLSKEERANLREAVRGLAAPVNEKVRKAAEAVKAYYADRPTRIREVGLTLRTKAGEDIPFQEAANHFPLRLDWKKIEKNGVIRQDVLEQMVKTGQAKDIMEADRILQILRRRPHERHATFQHEATRVSLPEFEIDPLLALRSDLSEGELRVAQARIFGLNDEGLIKAIEAMNPADREFALKVADRIRGIGSRVSDGERAWIDALLSFNILSKLNLSAVYNSFQLVNPTLRLGTKALVRGVRGAIANPQEGADFARKAGVVLDPANIAQAIAETRGGFGSVTSRWLRAIGMSGTEYGNRLVSALMGRGWADDMFQALQKPGSVSWVDRATGRQPMRIRRLFEAMGINVDTALKRGALSDEDYYRVARDTVTRTQFPTDPLDRPLWSSSPWGRVVFQFKNFAFNQGRLVKRELMEETARFVKTKGQDGSLRAWGPFLIAFPSAGWLADLVVDWARGRESPGARIERLGTAIEEGEIGELVGEYANAMLAVGGIGIITDTLRSLQFGAERATLGLAGPSAGLVVGAGEVTQPLLAEGGKMLAGEETDWWQALGKSGKAAVRTTLPFGRQLAKGQLPFGVQFMDEE